MRHDHHDHNHHDDHDDHEAGAGRDHAHGHANDQGISGALRYLRFARTMWRSDVNTAVIELVDPAHGECVVDIGAGMGAGTVVAAQSGATVVSVEPTPFLRRVLAARRRLQRARDRIRVVDGTAEALPVADDRADAVWAVNTMHHWSDVEAGVGEIARVLRPGGRIVLVDEDFTDPDHPDFERFGRNHDDDQHGDHVDGDSEHHHGFTMVDARRMGELLGAAGLVDVEASNRSIAGRPTIAVTASAPDDAS